MSIPSLKSRIKNNFDDREFIFFDNCQFTVSLRTVKFSEEHRLLIILHDIDPNNFEPFQKLLTDGLNEMNRLMEIYRVEIIECLDANDNLTHNFLIICQQCYTQIFNKYTKSELINDEIKFMTYDLLKIAQDVSKLKYPCVIDERTIMLSRDPASPFPKLMLSPLAFLLGKLNEVDGEENEDPFPQIANMIEKLGKLVENEEIIKELKNNQPIQNIMKLPNTTNLKYFVNGPVCSTYDYDCIEKLGNGGYGTVLKAVNSNGEEFAFKMAIADSNDKLIDHRINSLKREAIVMRLCEHKNIVKFISLATEELLTSSIEYSCHISQLKNVGIVMEYCKGGDLRQYVDNYRKKNNRDLPPNEIKNIFYQISEAHHFLHFEKRIIHRDIKLENFLIKYEPQLTIKCCDFGLARSISRELETKVGTIQFMAPEIFKKKNNSNTPYSDKSDLYSLGICLYYLTTGSYPFSDLTIAIREKEPVHFPLKYQTKEYESIIGLVTKLTKHEENERISWEEFYEHPYMK